MTGTPTVWIMETGETSEGGYITGVYLDRELARGDFVAQASAMCERFGEQAPDLAEMGDGGRLRVEVRCDWLTLTAYPVTTAAAIGAAPPQGQRVSSGLASCGHPADEDGECGCSSWPERAPGLYLPGANGIRDARPTRSATTISQPLGRIRRTDES
jgi:hypothetical protein